MARSFPGGTFTDYIDVGNQPSIDITGTVMTLAARFRWDVLVTDGVMIAKTHNSPESYQYAMSQSSVGDRLSAHIGQGNGVDTVSGATPLRNGVWYHGTMVKNGTGAGSLKLYVNGAEDGSVTSTKTITAHAGPLRFGRYGSYAVAPFSGDLAEVCIWNAALTPGEVAYLAAGAAPETVRRDAMKAYWPLCGTLSPEPDYISGCDGFIVGTVAADTHPVTTPRCFPGRPLPRVRATRGVSW